MTDLAEAVAFSSGGFTRLADRMAKEGLIRRDPDPDDRRAALAVLTEKGGEALDRALTAHVGHAFGATLLRPLMMRSIASPPVGSVRLASIFRVNFIRRGWVRPRWVAIFMTFGLPMSFTKARPRV